MERNKDYGDIMLAQSAHEVKLCDRNLKVENGVGNITTVKRELGISTHGLN